MTLELSRVAVQIEDMGRVLAERILDGRGYVTTFTVDPIDDARARGTIETTWTTRGLGSLFERMLVPGLLRRIYRAELAQLDRVARAR